MADKTEVEKRVNEIINDIEVNTKDTIALKTLKEKLEFLPDKPKGKEDNSSIWEALKLFLASVLGAVGSILINYYVEHSQDWFFLLITIFVLLGFSLIFVFLTNTLPKLRRKRKY